MKLLRTNMDSVAKNNAEKQSMSDAIGVINSFYPTNKDKDRLVKDINEYGIAHVAYISNFNLTALSIVYNGYMLEKREKKNKAKVTENLKTPKTTTGFSNFIVPSKLITGIQEYKGKFYLLCGQVRKQYRGEYFISEEDAMQFIYDEANQNLSIITEYAGKKSNWKKSLSKTDYEYLIKWDYYFKHLDTLNRVNELDVTKEQLLYIEEFLTGSTGLDNHKKHKGRQVDYRKLNDVNYSLKETTDDIDLVCRLVGNYTNNSSKQKGKRKK